MKNSELAHVLENVSIYLKMQDDAIFKIRAYENACQIIQSHPEEIEDVYKKGGIKSLISIRGIGNGIAKKLEELIKTGKLDYYEKLKRKTPIDLDNLRGIEGLGPKKIFILYKKLKIKNLQDLENAANLRKIRKLEGFKEKTEQNILKGINFHKKNIGRFILAYTFPILKEIMYHLKKQKFVSKVVLAGSVRRMKETIGDGDILVISKEPEKVMNYFTKIPEVINVISKGQTKSSVKLESGLNVDLRVLNEKNYAAALNYFTGSKEHNIFLRKIAISKNLKLNEYGLFRGEKQLICKNEKDIYNKLGLNYIEPELRENHGEIGKSKKNKLPKIIGYNELKGDLQVQTNWTDGVHSIEEMSNHAKKENLEYIVITDHTKSLAMTGGLDERKLEKQLKEIEKINKKINDIEILSGAEVNIMKDGSLDIKDKSLSKLDVVGASVHSNFNLSKFEMTQRIISAMENENVDIFFHPTGRLIQKREPYEIDIEKIIQCAKDTKTILEINSFPERSDLNSEHIRLAVDKKVKMCINSDAHSKNHFKFLKFGIAQARRGWATKKDIINAHPLKKMLKMLK